MREWGGRELAAHQEIKREQPRRHFHPEFGIHSLARVGRITHIPCTRLHLQAACISVFQFYIKTLSLRQLFLRFLPRPFLANRKPNININLVLPSRGRRSETTTEQGVAIASPKATAVPVKTGAGESGGFGGVPAKATSSNSQGYLGISKRLPSNTAITNAQGAAGSGSERAGVGVQSEKRRSNAVAPGQAPTAPQSRKSARSGSPVRLCDCRSQLPATTRPCRAPGRSCLLQQEPAARKWTGSCPSFSPGPGLSAFTRE
jgi:hypothetical protein